MTGITIRAATIDDVPSLFALIKALATYEKLADRVIATEENLCRHGFGAERRFEVLLAFSDGKPAGFALFLPNFSTFLGQPGLFLEDLYVEEWARKRGIGRLLIARLAAIALERGWQRLDLNVLDWNPARGFYERLGIRPQADWLPYRASGDALRKLAAADGQAFNLRQI